MTNLRFVMTGGPGAGKTTVLKALAQRGYSHVPESARTLIRRRLEAGLSPRPPLDQFGEDMLSMDITRYRETPVTDEPVFFDRGVLDALALLDQQDAISPAATEAHLREFRYNEVVLLIPPWINIYCTDAERDQTFSESIEVFERLSNWYTQWEYKTVEVPRAGIDQRVEFILKTIETARAMTPKP